MVIGEHSIGHPLFFINRFNNLGGMEDMEDDFQSHSNRYRRGVVYTPIPIRVKATVFSSILHKMAHFRLISVA